MLTTEQEATIAADIAADPYFSTLPHTSDSAFEIADLYAQPAQPDFIVWRTEVAQDEIMQNGFDWVRVDNLSVGKARIWEWMFDNPQRVFNPSKPNVRLGIDETWKGTAADLAVRTAVYVHCKRKANRLEKLLSTGTGTDAAPATMGFEGRLDYNEIKDVMGW